jgi:hypothetical protein
MKKSPVRILSHVFSALVWLALALGVAWVIGAMWFDFPWAGARKVAAGICGVGLLAAAICVRPRWRAKLGIAICILLVLVGWLTLVPRQHRDWKPEVAKTAFATVDGDGVTIENVRNNDYRTETDFTSRYETRRYDLRNLRGVDIFVNFWGSPHMAHPIISFDFGKDGRVCFSIETRMEKGESYSAIGGLYRRFESIYVVADERDVIRLRANYRQGEDVYLYRLKAVNPRGSFMEYIRAINELHETPRWYNAITNNCTTAIRNQRAATERQPWDWRMLVNGYGDELLYEKRGIDTSLPFAELKKLAHVNKRAKAANDAPDFSERIREGIPGMAK